MRKHGLDWIEPFPSAVTDSLDSSALFVALWPCLSLALFVPHPGVAHLKRLFVSEVWSWANRLGWAGPAWPGVGWVQSQLGTLQPRVEDGQFHS